MHLLQLKKNESARIVDYLDKELASRLLTLGLLPETKVTYVRKAPFGGAYYIKFNGHAIALRENEALSIIIEKL